MMVDSLIDSNIDSDYQQIQEQHHEPANSLSPDSFMETSRQEKEGVRFSGNISDIFDQGSIGKLFLGE